MGEPLTEDRKRLLRLRIQEKEPEAITLGEVGALLDEIETLKTERDIHKQNNAELLGAARDISKDHDKLEEKVVALRARIAELEKDRDRFQKIVLAVSPYLDPACLGKDADGFGAAARALVRCQTDRVQTCSRDLCEEAPNA